MPPPAVPLLGSKLDMLPAGKGVGVEVGAGVVMVKRASDSILRIVGRPQSQALLLV